MALAAMSAIYLDHNATTPVDSRVVAEMLPYWSSHFGNPSSRHSFGRTARAAIDRARNQVATAVGAHPTEVVFVSGGSEANNLLIRSVLATRHAGTALISAIEHPSVLQPAKLLQSQGWQVTSISVDGDGRILEADLAEKLRSRPNVVSIMYANNETGVIQDVARFAGMTLPAGSWFHSDGVQALGKIAIDFRGLNAQGVHALSISAHKVGGPKGAGALIVDKRLDLIPAVAGGGQERGLRGGTENVAAIVGFGLACELACQDLEGKQRHWRVLRAELEQGLLAQGARIYGGRSPRLANTVFFALPGIDGETLVASLDRSGFAVASGAACSSASAAASHVLLAMGIAADEAKGALRVSLGRDTTLAQIQDFLLALRNTVFQLKRLSALTG